MHHGTPLLPPLANARKLFKTTQALAAAQEAELMIFNTQFL
jgi:hypothetical protein